LRNDLAWFQTSLGLSASGAEGLNRVFTMHTHRAIDDWDSLSAALREVGFPRAHRSSLNGSTTPELRIDNDEPARALCSLYVEAQR
jgi:hypothetical protein